MAKIGRSFDELDQKIKQFNTSLKGADKQVKTLDKSLKLNPGNVDTVRQKYTLLSQNLQTNAQKIAALQEKQKRLTADYEAGAITQDTYNRQLAKTAQELEKAERETEELNAQLQQQNAAIRDAKFTKLTDGLTKVENVANKASVATLAVVAALTALVASAIKAGDELSDTATHFGTSVEELQLWQNRLGMLAKDQEAYTKSLEKVGSVLTSITAGRGARYLTYLEKLGIAQEDLNGKSNGEVFDMIYNGLRNVTDATDRATIAQGLLGDTGLEIAVIAGTEQESINALDEALIANGIITSEQAKYADEAANKMLALKQQFQANSMELMVALMPAFETLVQLLQTTVIPWLTTLANWLGGLSTGEMKMLMVLLGIIIVLPKIITLVKGVVTVMQMINAQKAAHVAATGAQTAAVAGLNAVSTPWLGIIIAISFALMALIQLIGWFVGGSNAAIDNANEMLAKIDEIDTKAASMGYDAEYSAEATYDTNTHKTVDINLDVNATGDGTEVSEENAEIIADNLEEKILVDLLNQGMGAVVR